MLRGSTMKMTNKDRIKVYMTKSIDELMGYIVNLVYEEGELLFWDEDWKYNIINYPHLYTYLVLNKLGESMKTPIEKYSQKYYLKIIGQSKMFITNSKSNNEEFNSYCKQKLFLNRFEIEPIKFWDEIGKISKNEIVLVKLEKSNSIASDDSCLISKSYDYITKIGDYVIEKLDYSRPEWYGLSSKRLEFTSNLKIEKREFSDVNIDNVISVAHTNDGYVYIRSEKGCNYIYGQGFTQCNMLNRIGKCPIYVKASGSRVAALMSDGTVTSNFCGTISDVICMGFDDNGDFVVKYNR